MVDLQTTDNILVGIAFGQDSDGFWYVQTTDLIGDAELSESILEGLESKDQAFAIAQIYVDKYNFKLFDWS